MDVADNADEALDPRIQIELENLNDATDDINKLETELDEAHTAFRQLLSETTKRLTEIINKVGNSSVERARCYYEALEEARQAQVKCQQQAQQFQRASEIHAAAKETVALAESRFMSHQHEWNFDQAWQDMLNHATLKVMDAENKKAECGREHYRRAILFHDAEKRLLQLAEKHHRHIIKARPYFEIKAQCDQMLATQAERVECLQKAIQDAKTNYSTSLNRLEEISNQIHQQRKDFANGPREPGVGAELVSPQKTGSYDMEFTQLNGNKLKDITKNQLIKYNRIDNYNNVECQLQEDAEHLGKRSVDGSEATSSQWELELKTNMDNVNNLSLENSVLDRNGEPSNLHFYNDESTKLKDLTQKLNVLESRDYSIKNFNQLKKLSENFQTFRSSFVNMPLMTHFEESHNEVADSMTLSKQKIGLKMNASKSLSNSPIKMNIFNLGSRFTEKGIYESIAKYVPNNILNFGFSNNKSQSSSDVNLSFNMDNNSVEKYHSLNDIVDDKTDNLEFDPHDTNLKHNAQCFTMKQADDNCLNTTKESRSAQLNNYSDVNSKSKTEQTSVRKSLFLSSSANSSPIKAKRITRLSSENCLNKKVTDDLNESAVAQKRNAEKRLNELPLLSLFEKDNSLENSKNKSFSMVNLGKPRDTINGLQLNNVITLSTERLTYLKGDSFLRNVR
ncbi:uncharacterized protein LOC108630281 isoform X2 [Ceratina calcarata]|uniref:Uncharacterized protein LOC108630281 isoform X2 n=1 Tax=Ceratina calcarata TaxID=156304 RepID=A0AAJ7JB95_9HYME|nr:uncharacterized protein LOC108630281 isoform X2 [Ceratina calcarata]